MVKMERASQGFRAGKKQEVQDGDIVLLKYEQIRSRVACRARYFFTHRKTAQRCCHQFQKRLVQVYKTGIGLAS